MVKVFLRNELSRAAMQSLCEFTMVNQVKQMEAS